MHSVPLFVLIAALWGWSAAVETLNCTDSGAVHTEKNNCLTTFGLTTNTDVDQLMYGFYENLNTACREVEKYKAAFSCAITIDRYCEETAGRDPDTKEDSQQAAKAVALLCDNAGDVDPECYDQARDASQNCRRDKLLAMFSNFTDDDATLFLCKEYEFYLECINEPLSACSGKTKEVFLSYIKYMTPPICNGAPFPNSTPFWILSIVAFVAVVLDSSLDF